MTDTSPAAPARAPVSASPWAPLSLPVFRMLWVVWMTANACMWMNDVAAAWMMTTLTPSPTMVALVQTASTQLWFTPQSLTSLHCGLASPALAQ